MKRTLCSVLIAILLCGCSSTHRLQSPLDANHAPITDRANIVLRSGEIIEATNIEVGPATTRYIVDGIGSFRYVPTNTISELHVTDYFRGVVGGFMAGAMGGMVGGVATAGLAGDLRRGEGGMVVLGYMGAGMLIGGASGLAYGGLHGYQHHYIFPADTTSKHMPLRN